MSEQLEEVFIFKPARLPWLNGANRRSPIIDRFWAKVRRDEGTSCWRWVAHIQQGAGYGMFSENGKALGAHRWSYEYFNGPIPEGLHIDHLCENRYCVNPNHLEAVTQGETTRRAYARKTRCRTGRHPKNGLGRCLECERDTGRRGNRRYRAKNRRTSP